MAVPSDKELRKLLDRFVCVRRVQMWGIDLSRFQFDGGLTWAIFLMHADGTIYGRYGSRSGLRDESAKDISLAGFKKTLRRALELHESYRKDKDSVARSLAGKSAGDKPTWKTPEAIPQLKSRGRYTSAFTGAGGRRGNCIHCHMIPVSEIRSLRAAGKPIPDKKFWPYPMPDEIGLHMDPEEVATVQRVRSGSDAERAGFKVDDRILRLARQPILSTADIQWVLHNAGDSDTLAVQIEREGEPRTLTLTLERGWRRRLSEWRFFNVGLQRQVLQFGCRPVAAGERTELGLARNALALRVQRLPRDVSRRRNIREGDVVVAVDGKRDSMNLGAFTAYVYRKKRPGDTLRLTLLRGGKEHDVDVAVR